MVTDYLDLARSSRPKPTATLEWLLRLAQQAVSEVKARQRTPGAHRGIQLARLRGNGPGVSFSDRINTIEQAFPLRLRFPFEGSPRVGGAVWNTRDLLGPDHADSVAKLRWKPGASDLPMHTHRHSDRFIVVLKGRGFFHHTDQGCGDFDGSRVSTIAARERDVFIFTRGTVHTFSTDRHAMTLISCQLPYLPFDHQDQYTLPATRWTARDYLDPASSQIVLLPDQTHGHRLPRPTA